ncbi:MAG TPA: MFS transporter [Jatrophihabitantaceae bacterium]|nr:MFS transporter [Mycobacteriales bacterium]HZY77215.1 MFS transporter [Jatrophihabitantaceae bacterium]
MSEAAHPEGAEAPTRTRRRLFADLSPLRESPTYRRWWAGYAVSNIGSQLTIVAAQLQVYDLTHSSLDVGFVGLVTVVPLIVFGLLGGSVADAFDRRKLMLLTSAGLMVTSTGLLVQAATHAHRLSVIYVLLGLQAGIGAFDSAARGATLPRLVRADLLPAANSLGQLGWNTALTVGPLLAGVVAGAAGYSAAYALDVASFAAVFYGVVRLPPIRPDSTSHRAGFRSVVEGLRFLAPRKNLMMTFLVDIDAMVFGMPRALFPALAVVTFHGGKETAGLLYAAPSIGAFLGAAFSGWASHVRRQGLAVVVSIVVWGATIALFGLVHVLWIGVVLLAVAGWADMISAIFRSTILQVATPDSLRGRLQGVFTVVVAGGPRIGDLESGTVARLAGTEFSVVSGGIACIVGVLLLAGRFPSFAKYDAKEPVP